MLAAAGIECGNIKVDVETAFSIWSREMAASGIFDRAALQSGCDAAACEAVMIAFIRHADGHRGSLNGFRPAAVEEGLVLARGDVARIRKAFESLGLIDGNRLARFEQYHRRGMTRVYKPGMTATERSRKYRQKLAQAPEDLRKRFMELVEMEERLEDGGALPRPMTGSRPDVQYLDRWTRCTCLPEELAREKLAIYEELARQRQAALDQMRANRARLEAGLRAPQKLTARLCVETARPLRETDKEMSQLFKLLQETAQAFFDGLESNITRARDNNINNLNNNNLNNNFKNTGSEAGNEEKHTRSVFRQGREDTRLEDARRDDKAGGPALRASQDIARMNEAIASGGGGAALSGKDAERRGPGLLTVSGRWLGGEEYKRFMAFWKAFDYPHAKAKAADAWLDIADMTPDLGERIALAAAECAKQRPELEAKNMIPMQAPNWLINRRFEDYEGKPAAVAAPKAEAAPKRIEFDEEEKILLKAKRSERMNRIRIEHGQKPMDELCANIEAGRRLMARKSRDWLEAVKIKIDAVMAPLTGRADSFACP